LLFDSAERDFKAYADTCTEQVRAPGDNHILLDLEEHLPATVKGIGMLVAQVDAADEIVKVTAAAGTDTEVSVMVTAPGDTRLIADAEVPGVIAVPETLLGDMSGDGIFLVLDIVVAEELPRIMVSRGVLDGKGGIDGSLQEPSHAKRQVVVVRLSLSTADAEHQQWKQHEGDHVPATEALSGITIYIESIHICRILLLDYLF